MVIDLLVLAVAGLTLCFAGLLVRLHAADAWRTELVAHRLRFARRVDAKQVVALVNALAGLAPVWWQRPFAARALVLQAVAAPGALSHHLLVPRRLAEGVVRQVRMALPSVHVEADPDYVAPAVEQAVELALSTWRRPLRTDATGSISAALLAALGAGPDEQVNVVQLVVVPEGGGRPVAPQAPAGIWLLAPDAPRQRRDTEALKAARAKLAGPLFGVTVRLGAQATSAGTARAVLGRLATAVRATAAPGVHWRRRPLPGKWAARRLRGPVLPLHPTALLNAGELAALVAYPTGEAPVPGLALGGCRLLPPAARIPRAGRVLALSNAAPDRPLALSPLAALRHMHVIGPTGSGKTWLLVRAILSDISTGAGVIVVDPTGDSSALLLDRLATADLDRLALIDPAGDELWPTGVNLLAGDDSPELLADQVVGVFSRVFRAGWGHRTDDVFRSALLTLAATPGMTIVESLQVITDEAFRRPLVGALSDPVLLQFWSWFDALTVGERASVIAPLANKLRAVLLRRRVRNVLGQAEPRFTFDQALAERRVVLMNLSKGALGQEVSQLLSALLISQLWRAVQRRARLAPSARPRTYLYCDEAQDLAALPTPLDELLTQARGLALGATLSHQHLDQLTPQLRHAALANCATRVIFRTAADDARVLAQDLTPHLEAADLQGLGAHEVVARLALDDGIAPPATGVTLPLPPVTGSATEARRRSRAQYGRDRAEVEAALRQRQERYSGRGPLGRKEAS